MPALDAMAGDAAAVTVGTAIKTPSIAMMPSNAVQRWRIDLFTRKD